MYSSPQNVGEETSLTFAQLVNRLIERNADDLVSIKIMQSRLNDQ